MKTIFADRTRVLRQIQTWADQLKAKDQDVERVGLFGSYATGTYGPASDADLLIVLRRSEKRFMDRIPDYLPEGISICCDVFPYTADEIETARHEGSAWIKHLLSEVIWL